MSAACVGGTFLTGAGSRLWRSWVAVGALALIVGAPAVAFGGAWTLPQGTGQLIETLYGWTGFGPPWGGNPPVNQSRFDAQTYVQYGLTDSLTVFGQTALRTLCARAADAKHLQRPRLFGCGPEGETLVDRRMGVLGRSDRVRPRRP